MTMPTTANDAVANGVEFLDQKVPGWWKVIDIEQLRMSDCSMCMLGQLFGHDVETALGSKMFGLPINPEYRKNDPNNSGYVRARDMFCGGDVRNWGTTVGCNVPYSGEVKYTYDDLRCEWIKVIADRRAAEPEGQTNNGN